MQGYQTQHPQQNNRKCAPLQLDSKPGRRQGSLISMRASILPSERLSGTTGRNINHGSLRGNALVVIDGPTPGSSATRK
jgi:hypothetical protein